MTEVADEEIDAVLRVMVKCGIIRVAGKDPKTGETLYEPNPGSDKDCSACQAKYGAGCPLLNH